MEITNLISRGGGDDGCQGRHQFLTPGDLNGISVMAACSEVSDWGLLLTGVPDAHKHTRGAGVIVAVLDTGGPDHADLIVNLLPAANCTHTNSAADRQGHGTHVAGIIGAAANGFGIVGVAPEARILPIKVLGDNGLASYDEIERGIRLATERGADIINMSLGSPVEPPASLHEAIKDAAAKGIILFAAAGNDGGQVNWPARYPEVIAVAAVDRQGSLAGFSSRGEKVALTAPGVDIYSTYLAQGYAQLSGTSQASPFAAGVGALILSWARKNAGIVPPVTDVRDMLARLDDVCGDGPGLFAPGSNMGVGMPEFANVRWADTPVTAASAVATVTAVTTVTVATATATASAAPASLASSAA